MAEDNQSPGENGPIEQNASEEQAGTPNTAPVGAPTPEDKQTAAHERTTLILGGVILILAILLCVALASLIGVGLRGPSEPAATPTPAPKPTPVPTPEPGQPPTAVIYAPNTGIVGVPITFDGGGSAGASPIVRYDWDFGDGAGARGAVVQHAYNKPGRYTLTLTVSDEHGLSDNASMRIDISEPEPTPEPQPPTAVINAPTSALVGEAVTFNGGESSGENPIVNYSWDFGDRNSGNGAVVQHAYGKANTYKVTLTVTDNQGLTGSSSMEIIINEQPQSPPTAVIAGPAQALVNEQVTYDASGSSPGSSPIVNYAWDFGNGKTTSGRNEVLVKTTFSAPGQYNVVLTVTDENGLSNTSSMQTSVSSTLQNTDWLLMQSLPETDITIQFKKGNVSGSTGCNDYSGKYTVSDEGLQGAITLSDVTVTRKSCNEDVMAQESQYLATLQAVTNYAIDGSTLSLTGAGGALTYTDQSVPAPAPR